MSSVIARVRDGSLRAIRERDVHRFRWWSLYAQQLADRGKAKTSDAAALSFARSLRVVRFPSDARSVLQSTGGGCGGGGVDGRASAPSSLICPHFPLPQGRPSGPVTRHQAQKHHARCHDFGPSGRRGCTRLLSRSPGKALSRALSIAKGTVLPCVSFLAHTCALGSLLQWSRSLRAPSVARLDPHGFVCLIKILVCPALS
ncbi:hypothetical protein HPB51_018001 [Rhipicephalus microplus]|uniref:Uncharacterized protein n=1 Tax=Rhipicephalus microplus TaxID=6941 RepID=A0A9J6D5Z1_RHIMP|nr:hypothetical protein HPB51_018001 [Rhipicephalus microplus]